MLGGTGRFARLVSLLAALLLVPGGSADASDNWDDLLTKGVVAISKKDYDNAAAIFSQAIGLRSDVQADVKVRRFRSTAYWLAGKFEQAEADLTEVVRLVGETDPGAYEERGRFYYQNDRYTAALADYITGARLFPQDGRFANGQGLTLTNQGEHDEAIKQFDAAIKLDPSSAIFVLGRAEAYNRSKREQLAIEDYDRALALGRLTPNDTGRLRSGRGYAYLRLKDYTAAIADFDLALELRPRHINALKWRALAFERVGNTERALRDYEAALAMTPADKMIAKRIEDLRAQPGAVKP
ncbi:tetratricopeptide repeat protein [Tardiphaga alba]|uniref:Tetratricopeptide repeat protein n=1 Tax=Tardiphaga alba TaxID=340268 RepID=A0ABX8AAK0_9BRAD|nr:tetratricopeptide repeat protein [Tardiphaga alba]QUS40801.1 tetratricopeptide repeat protein [Tardiphaga alba]